MKRPFLALLWKELRLGLPGWLLTAGVMAAWVGSLLTRLGVWEREAVAGLTLVPVLVLVPIRAFWLSFQGIWQEWSRSHALLLLTLPVPGWWITGAKLLAVWIQSVGHLVLGLLGTGIVFWVAALTPMQQLPTTVRPQVAAHLLHTFSYFILAYILSLFLPMVLAQFAALVGRLAPRLQLAAAGVAFAVGGWLMLRLGAVVGVLLRWVPEITVVGFSYQQQLSSLQVVSQAYHVQVAPALGALVVLAGLWWLGSYLLERDAEV